MTCKICNEKKKIEVTKNNFFLRTDSKDKKLNDYKNYVCFNCGNIYTKPKIPKKKLIKYYDSNYRKTESQILIDKKPLDLPFKFEWTGVSFQRFHAFYEILKNYKKIKLKKSDLIFDYGCYQGAFLYACKETYGTRVLGTDYNSNGLDLAKKYFNINTLKISQNLFNQKINAKIITLLHVFEHLDDPVNFLIKIKKNILSKNGYLYLEIPNPFHNPLDDPTHLNLYSDKTIKYLLECAGYEICIFKKKGIYKSYNYLRDNENLNIHVLAKINKNNKIKFHKINIGSEIYSRFIKERNKSTKNMMIRKIKGLLFNILHTSYTFFLFLINIFSSNLSVSVHKFFVRILKKND